MGKGKGKDDAFVKRAFATAVKEAAMSEEAHEAESRFKTMFSDVMSEAMDVLGEEKALEFIRRLGDERGREGAFIIANFFFLAGFRNGVVYTKRHKR